MQRSDRRRRRLDERQRQAAGPDPWVTPTAPQYGCTPILETGDPVVGIGFNLAGNSFKADQLADGTANKWDDGTWHPEDEVFLPWFSRESPNRTSQQVQNGKYGRYTFWARSTRTPGSRKPATGC